MGFVILNKTGPSVRQKYSGRKTHQNTSMYVCVRYVTRHGQKSDSLGHVLPTSVAAWLITESSVLRPPHFLNITIIRSGNVGPSE